MARIRSIKPEFWCDEKLSECSLSARLLFIGLWNFCDDDGRMTFQPSRIKMQIFPCGTVTSSKLTEFLGELREHSLIVVYVVDGKEYLAVPNFTKHQKINRPTPSRLPPPSEVIHGVPDGTHGVLTEHSPLEGNGREGREEGTGEIAAIAAQPAPKVPRGKKPKAHKSPLPEDFELDAGLRAYAEERLPMVDAIALFESFCGKARAKGWEYVSWSQAFQEYCRNCAPSSGHWASGQYPKRSTRDDPPGYEAVRW